MLEDKIPWNFAKISQSQNFMTTLRIMVFPDTRYIKSIKKRIIYGTGLREPCTNLFSYGATRVRWCGTLWRRTVPCTAWATAATTAWGRGTTRIWASSHSSSTGLSLVSQYVLTSTLAGQSTTLLLLRCEVGWSLDQKRIILSSWSSYQTGTTNNKNIWYYY